MTDIVKVLHELDLRSLCNEKQSEQKADFTVAKEATYSSAFVSYKLSIFRVVCTNNDKRDLRLVSKAYDRLRNHTPLTSRLIESFSS